MSPTKKVILLIMSFLILISVTSIALASTGGDYVLDWWTVDGGGDTSSGGDYSVSGSIGQPDAGGMAGGDYALTGGFWQQSVIVFNPPPSTNTTLYRFPNLIPAGSAASGPNQWYAKVVPGTEGDDGDPFHFVVWLHLPEDWQLPWARQYSFTGDFDSPVLSQDTAAQAWITTGGNCPMVGGPASTGYKWRAFIGPEENLPTAGARLDNYVNLRGGLRVPLDETPDMYYEFLMVVGVYYDSGIDGVPDSYACSGGAVPVITVE